MTGSLFGILNLKGPFNLCQVSLTYNNHSTLNQIHQKQYTHFPYLYKVPQQVFARWRPDPVSVAAGRLHPSR